MSSISLVYSNRKVCAEWDGQSRRFRLFAIVDPTTRKACKGGPGQKISIDFFFQKNSRSDPNFLKRSTDKKN